MKKIFYCLFAFALTAAAFATPKHNAAQSDSSDSSTGQWFLGAGPLLSFPVEDINTQYASGIGFKAYLGTQLNKDLALQLDLDNVSYSKGSLSDYELRALPTLKYFLGGEGTRPYLLGGLGLDFQFASASGQSAAGTSIEEYFGAGFQFLLSPRTYLFLEGKYSFIFSSGVTGEDLPFVAGVEFGI